MRWLNGGKSTLEEVRLAFPVAADNDVDFGVEVVDDLILIGFEVFERDELHC